jgi:hypothetical protein
MRLDGCSIEEISFENTHVSGYTNGTDAYCQMFSSTGGQRNWPDLPEDIFNAAWSSESDYGEPIFTIKNKVPEIGTDGSTANNYDLMMLVEGLNESICAMINEKLYDDATIPVNDDAETKYDGTINTTDVATFAAALTGWRQGCYQDNNGADSGTYTYFYVISAR